MILRRLALAAVLPIALAGCASGATATPTASAVPVISNIPRPNAACVPADRQAIDSAGNDLNSRLFFGFVDGEQKEMPLGQALNAQINGHKVQYAWVCPSRAEWK